MDWSAPGSGSDELSMYIEQRMLKKVEPARMSRRWLKLPGTERRNESRDANEINVVVSESSRYRKKCRTDVETVKNRSNQRM